MLNWLKDLYNGASGVLSTIERWVVGALNVVYSYFSDLISQLWVGLQQLANTINKYIGQLELTLYNMYNLLQWVLNTGIPELENWALNQVTKVYDYAKSVYAWALSELNRLEAWAVGELDKLTQWILKNIWDPLWNAITNAVKWIENEGAYVYYLLTHPDKLAAFLAKYILGTWMDLGRTFSKPFIKWLVHNMALEIPSVSSIIEDIIASLF